MIVIPERETPGISESAWAVPMPSADQSPMSLEPAVLRAPVCYPQQHAEEREVDRDLPRRAEMLFDHIRSDRACDRSRDRRCKDEPGDLLVSRPDRPAADGTEPGGDEAQDVRPEVRDDGDQCPEMQRDVERLVEVRVLLEVTPVAEPRDENQVAGGGDREQLGEALDDAEGEGLPVGELPGLLADTGKRQDEGESQQRDRGSVDESAAAHRRDRTRKPD